MQLASLEYVVILHVQKWVGDREGFRLAIQALKVILELPQIKKVGVNLMGRFILSTVFETLTSVQPRGREEGMEGSPYIDEGLCGVESNDANRRPGRVFFIRAASDRIGENGGDLHEKVSREAAPHTGRRLGTGAQ